MLQLDILSSLAICGAGALVGGAMRRPSLAQDAASAEALRICRSGYALIGRRIAAALGGGEPVAAMAIGVTILLMMFSCSLRASFGKRWPMAQRPWSHRHVKATVIWR